MHGCVKAGKLRPFRWLRRLIDVAVVAKSEVLLGVVGLLVELAGLEAHD
jgi:hypothetical protein